MPHHHVPLTRLAVLIGLCLCVHPFLHADAGVVELPIFTKGARILFQGDSITDMNRGRSDDPNHILGHSYVFLIACSYGYTYPDLQLTFINRGVSGNTVENLQSRWQADTIDLKPDILSILIGVNDQSAGTSITAYEEGYGRLLAQVVAAQPKVHLVLGDPFGLPVAGLAAPEHWKTWSAGLAERRAVVARLAATYHAAVAHYQQAFDKACTRAPADYWIWDGVHPTYRGQQVLANEWIRAVRAEWPTAPH